MERWIAIVLALIVIIVGFAVVRNIMVGQSDVAKTGNDVECIVKGGQCLENCPGEVLTAQCREGRQCCEV